MALSGFKAGIGAVCALEPPWTSSAIAAYLEGMDIATIQPVMGTPHLQQILQTALPQYSFVIRGNALVVGNGLCTGLQLKLAAPTVVRTGWVIPNMFVQIVWSLTMVLTGILPGLLVYGLIYLVVKGEVARLEQNIQTILRGGSVAMAAPGPGRMPVMAAPAKPGAGLLPAAIVTGLIALGSFGAVVNNVSEYMTWRRYERADRVRSLFNSYSNRSYGSYGSYGYGSSYGSSYGRSSRSQSRAENAAIAAVSGVFFTLLTAGLLIARVKKIAAANGSPMQAMQPMQPMQPMPSMQQPMSNTPYPQQAQNGPVQQWEAQQPFVPSGRT